MVSLPSRKADGAGLLAEQAWIEYFIRQWKSFENPAREDGLQLSHWQRVSPSEAAGGSDQSMGVDADAAGGGSSSKEYAFAKYNTTTNVYSYSSDEYLSHLRDESGNWSREETDYLFNLCHKYDLRWFVIKDRWDFDNPEREGQASTAEESTKPAVNGSVTNGTTGAVDKVNGDATMKTEETASTSTTQDTKAADPQALTTAPTASGPFAAAATPGASASEGTQSVAKQEKRERTIEEMKDRYYSVCRKLIRARPASDENAKQALLQSYAFDKGEQGSIAPADV